MPASAGSPSKMAKVSGATLKKQMNKALKEKKTEFKQDPLFKNDKNPWTKKFKRLMVKPPDFDEFDMDKLAKKATGFSDAIQWKHCKNCLTCFNVAHSQEGEDWGKKWEGVTYKPRIMVAQCLNRQFPYPDRHGRPVCYTALEDASASGKFKEYAKVLAACGMWCRTEKVGLESPNGCGAVAQTCDDDRCRDARFELPHPMLPICLNGLGLRVLAARKALVPCETMCRLGKTIPDKLARCRKMPQCKAGPPKAADKTDDDERHPKPKGAIEALWQLPAAPGFKQQSCYLPKPLFFDGGAFAREKKQSEGSAVIDVSQLEVSFGGKRHW